jgi:hypothetical protein
VANPKETKWVAVYETHLPEFAHLMAAKLESEGIATVIQGDTTRAFGFLVGRGAKIEVMVDVADAIRATAILEEPEDDDDIAE